jgi:menaquinone-9 beta-reductase
MMEKCVIVGGGVASLSAAIQLADAGLKPLIIDAGNYPTHRICGEFFSHESLPILQKWEITLPGKIYGSRFYKDEKKIQFYFKTNSGSCSRYDFDMLLLQRAKRNGARILIGTTVESLKKCDSSSGDYLLSLSNGDTIETSSLVMGTGKLPKTGHQHLQMPMKYVGFKAHFEGIEMDDFVEMHTFNGGYLGMAKINSTTTNIACIADKAIVDPFDKPEHFLDQLMKDIPTLRKKMINARMLFPKWLVGQIPEFGIREHPHWDRAFWIGDAAGSIPPVSGEGLAIAVTSGCMAADYLMHSDSRAFETAWLKRYKRRFFWAVQLHRIMRSGFLGHLAMYACRAFPFLPYHLWKLTREE